MVLKNMEKEPITLTFGETVENYNGMEMNGNRKVLDKDSILRIFWKLR